jgi:hypothetical protein
MLNKEKLQANLELTFLILVLLFYIGMLSIITYLSYKSKN